MQQGIVPSCWAPYGHVNVQSATEKAHDVKKAGEGKKKAAPKKVSAATLQCPATCSRCPCAAPALPQEWCLIAMRSRLQDVIYCTYNESLLQQLTDGTIQW